jgi:hypothetical protein
MVPAPMTVIVRMFSEAKRVIAAPYNRLSLGCNGTATRAALPDLSAALFVAPPRIRRSTGPLRTSPAWSEARERLRASA